MGEETRQGAGAAEGARVDWLAHVPVPLFAAVMGIGGLGGAWRLAVRSLGVPALVGEALYLIAAALFACLAVLYGLKAVRHWAAVRAEFHHPVRASFFGAISISLMVLAGGALPYAAGLADGLWMLAAALQVTIAAALMSRWLHHPVELQHATPAWFIPVVGNIVLPVTGAQLGHVSLSWFFFSVGLVFWLSLFPVLLNRLIFAEKLTRPLYPMLFILLPPATVGYAAYVALTGDPADPAGMILCHAGFFIALVLACLWRQFLAVPFSLVWWAYTFPLATLATAAMIHHLVMLAPFSAILAIGSLWLATGVTALVAARTLFLLVQGRLFVPQG